MKKLIFILGIILVSCVEEIPPMEASQEWICKWGKDLNNDEVIDEADWLIYIKGIDGQNGQDGKNGEDGKDGENGKDGEDGMSAYMCWVYSVLFEFIEWDGDTDLRGYFEFLRGKDGKDGINGQTPYIKDGYWWIGDENTGVKAVGKDVQDYTPPDEDKYPYIYLPSHNVDFFAEGAGWVTSVSANAEWTWRPQVEYPTINFYDYFIVTSETHEQTYIMSDGSEVIVPYNGTLGLRVLKLPERVTKFTLRFDTYNDAGQISEFITLTLHPKGTKL